jgi:hypothetical protein
MQNHTHTDYSHHWYIRTMLQCSHIFMTRYAKSHTHRLQSSLIHQNNVTMQPYIHDEICKITHTQITVIIDTSEQGYNAAISSWRDMQNHTHTQITVIIDTSEQGYNAAISSWRDMQNHTHTSILLTGRRSCSQVIDLAARGHWISSISIDGLENWFLACNETTKLSEPALLFARAFREWREKA